MPRQQPFDARSARDRSIGRACGAVSFFVPFAVSLAHVSSASSWRDDAALLRGLAWVGSGHTGGLGSILVQSSFFLPLGSLYFRAGFLLAIVVGAIGFLIFSSTRGLLAQSANMPALAAALSAIAALTSTLSATGQREGTVAGGGAVAVATALLVLRAPPAQALGNSWCGLVSGMVWGGLLAENYVVGGAVGLAVGLGFVVGRARVTAQPVFIVLAGAAATALFVLAPVLVRPFARAPFVDWTSGLAALGPAPLQQTAERLGGLGRWRSEVGTAALALSFAGAVLLLLRRALRAWGTRLLAIVVVDLASSFGEGKIFSSDELAPLHWLAIFALAAGMTLAVQTLAGLLLRWQLPLARGAAVLLVMAALTIAAASAEEASFTVDRSAWRGADAFTDEALENLAPHSAVVVKAPAVAARFWSARLAQGARPDVLVVPQAASRDTRLALGLLRAEPALHKVLRDLSLEGRPNEEALTVLADARPALVELDNGWDRRVLSHLLPEHLWLRFAPEPRGPSDRKAAFSAFRAAAARVAASLDSDPPDRSTAVVLRARLADAAVQAAVLGDREEANLVLDQLGPLSEGDLFVAELRQRLSITKAGPVDIRGLLR